MPAKLDLAPRPCRLTGELFSISELEAELCREFGMALPTLHPRERLRKLAAFNNYLTLYRGTCAATGEKIIQMFPPGTRFPIYSMPYWWGDGWDGLTYGRAYDFKRGFFAQLKELSEVVPQAALSVNYATNENCEYVNGMSYSRNCYLSFLSPYCEDCLYCFSTWRSRDCIDCTSTYDSELCYDCVSVTKGYALRHAFNCEGCSESAFLWNCISCKNCFGCVNLRQAQHCYYNEQLTADEYHRRLAAIPFDDYTVVEAQREQFMRFAKTFPQPAMRGATSSDSSGDFLEHCSRVTRSFDCAELEDGSNCLKMVKAKTCVDCYSWGAGTEFAYNCSRVGTNASRIACSFLVYSGTSDVEYSMTCIGCKDCFGCVGLRNKQYCILNRQYPKEEYFDLRRRIIAQMKSPEFTPPDERYGEFFPYSLALVPYNISDAMFYFPTTRSFVEKIGGRWEDYDEPEKVTPTQSGIFPQRSSGADSSVAQKPFRCVVTGRAFRVTQRELDAYRQRLLPFPHVHWRERMEVRSKLANPYELYPSRSAKSGAELSTSFKPDSGWIVWSRDEYEQQFE